MPSTQNFALPLPCWVGANNVFMMYLQRAMYNESKAWIREKETRFDPGCWDVKDGGSGRYNSIIGGCGRQKPLKSPILAALSLQTTDT